MARHRPISLTPTRLRKVLLLSRDITTDDLARKAGCTPSMIRAVIMDRETTPRIRRVIARACRVSLKALGW